MLNDATFATTSHGVDIDFGLSSDGEVDQLVKLAGGDSRQIPIKNNEGEISVADLMVREPQTWFRASGDEGWRQRSGVAQPRGNDVWQDQPS